MGCRRWEEGGWMYDRRGGFVKVTDLVISREKHHLKNQVLNDGQMPFSVCTRTSLLSQCS